MRVAVGLALLLLLTAAAYAADRRTAVDPNTPPWNAVAKVQTNTGVRCTGVLIAPTVVLTAAHCLHNRLTGALLQPVSLHVLFGYRRGAFTWHGTVVRLVTGAGFQGSEPRPQTADWARIELAEAAPGPPLPIFGGHAGAGSSVVLAGYNQDRAQLLMADLSCHVLHEMPAGQRRYLVHDCAATRGTSGAPLLTRQHDGWAVVGINIAAGPNANLALGLIPEK